MAAPRPVDLQVRLEITVFDLVAVVRLVVTILKMAGVVAGGGASREAKHYYSYQ